MIFHKLAVFFFYCNKTKKKQHKAVLKYHLAQKAQLRSCVSKSCLFVHAFVSSCLQTLSGRMISEPTFAVGF